MRVLIGGRGADESEPNDALLAELYSVPTRPWLRCNMVTTVDGAATGADGLTGSINNAADKRIFHLLRRTADAIVVGAGTARSEGYGPAVRPIIVVSRRGSVPRTLLGLPAGAVLMATCSQAPDLRAAQVALGEQHVLTLGEDEVDLDALVSELAARGMTSLLCEGGPHLLSDLLAAGLVDELCVTQVPLVVGGAPLGMTAGSPIAASFDLKLLLEHDGTLLGRWFMVR